jgi:ABC-type transporter Mla maintaining outer membrane lipid asymmetry ATPase subunit MlaF
MTPILEARGLTKRFGRVQALAGLDLVVRPGRVAALLGPNGAGKTTLVRAVATLLPPDAGSLHVVGIDALRHPAQVRQLIGLAGQYAAVEGAMTGRENLEMVGRLFGLTHQRARAAAAAVLDQLRLTPTPTGWSAPTPAGFAAAWTLASAWSGRRACCCSTSPPRAWTPPAAASCGTRSASLSPPGPMSC